MKAIIFGATPSAKKTYEEIEKKYEIIAYCDNSKEYWGGGIVWKRCHSTKHDIRF